MDIRQMLLLYTPSDEQEASDRAMMVRALDELKDPFLRENPFAHFTASSWIVNRDRTKVLMAWHNIYKTWAWTGGHADGDTDLPGVALREAREETGLREITPLSDGIFSLEILPVFAHVKRGKYVSNHLHMNVTFLMEADERQAIACKPDENSAVAWLPLKEAEDNREEPFIAVIYKKLNRKALSYPAVR